MAKPITLNPDGPHSPEYTRQVAGALAESVRVLNLATGNHASAGLRYPADVDAVVQELAIMAQRLPQLLDQIGGWEAHEQDVGHLAVTYGQWQGNPDEAVTQVLSWLHIAEEAAGELHRALDGARQVTAAISATYDPAEDPDA